MITGLAWLGFGQRLGTFVLAGKRMTQCATYRYDHNNSRVTSRSMDT